MSVSILPRLATGINTDGDSAAGMSFLFFPVLRRGSTDDVRIPWMQVSILPRLATGILSPLSK